MGRWAQRQRTGGGINTPVFIVSAEVFDAHTILLRYNRNIEDFDWQSNMFDTFPGGHIPLGPVATEPDLLELDFSPDISGQTKINFTGSLPNVLTPQTLDL